MEVKKPKSVSAQEHQEAIDILKSKAYKLSFKIGTLPKSRKTSAQVGDKAAKAIGGNRKGVKTSWQMFTSEHPAVKQLNSTIADLAAYRDSFARIDNSSTDKEDQEGGKRFILADDHAEIYQNICRLAGRIHDAAVVVQDALPQIKQMDAENAMEAWDESKYPTRPIQEIVGLAKDTEGNYIVDFEPAFMIPEGLRKDLKDALIVRLDAKLSSSLEAATENAVETLNGYLLTFLGELQNRTQLEPPEGSSLAKYALLDKPEVIREVRHENDPAIEPGMVHVLLSYKASVEMPVEEGEEPKFVKRTIKEWLEPMSEEFYAEQGRPVRTNQARKLYSTVIDGLLNNVEEFRKHQSKLLGVHGGNVETACESLMGTLKNLQKIGDRRSVGEITVTKLKKDADFKKQIANMVGETISALDDCTTEVRSVRRRRVHKGPDIFEE